MTVDQKTERAGDDPAISLSRVGVSIPEGMMNAFDQIMDSGGYSSRSEGIREALRYYIQHYEWINEVKGDRIAVICVVFDPGQPGLVGRINNVQHDFHCVIRSSFQSNLNNGDFLRILSLHGDATILRKVDERLMALKGVKFVKLTTMRPAELSEKIIN